MARPHWPLACAPPRNWGASLGPSLARTETTTTTTTTNDDDDDDDDDDDHDDDDDDDGLP